MSVTGHKKLKKQVNSKIVNFKKGNRDSKNYLNKMKILVMNSITFKIPILTANNCILPLYDSSKNNSDLKCNKIYYQYLDLVQIVFYDPKLLSHITFVVYSI